MGSKPKAGKGRGCDAQGRSETAPRFVQLEHWFLDHPAVLRLSGDAFKVMVYMHKRFTGYNNGVIGFGTRSGCTVKVNGKESVCKDILPHKGRADRSGKSVQGRVRRALKELEAAGFIVCTKESTFDQKRRAREWRLTWIYTGSPERPTPATREYAQPRPAENLKPSVMHEPIPPLQSHARTYDRNSADQISSYSVTHEPIAHSHRFTHDAHLVTRGSGGRESKIPQPVAAALVPSPAINQPSKPIAASSENNFCPLRVVNGGAAV
jgi:hypothetical protein